MAGRFVLTLIAVAFTAPTAIAQRAEIHTGDAVPRDVRDVYERGLEFLSSTQREDGTWPSNHRGAGVTALGLMCFLASGEDPNFGKYSSHVRGAIRSIISAQNASTGYYGQSMYHHGFAMLAMAEAYGMVDERGLWIAGRSQGQRTIGESLELAVRTAVTSQKTNKKGAWRYNPRGGNAADTSVAGCVLMGLLAARNSGVEVPDEAIDRAIAYFVSMTSPSGQVAYAGGLGGFNESMARISIATLVYSIARRRDLPQYQQTLNYLRDKPDGGNAGHGGVEYRDYYQAQALFQGDIEMWRKWNEKLIRRLKETQKDDGSYDGTQGKYVATTLSLLALAVNYRFLPIYER